MNGNKLIAFLKNLGIGDGLTGVSADYLFDTPLAESLTVLCKNVDKEQVLTHEELRAYHLLEDQGQVLDDEALDRILSIDATESEFSSDEEDDIEVLEAAAREKEVEAARPDEEICRLQLQIDAIPATDPSCDDQRAEDLETDVQDKIAIIGRFSRDLCGRYCSQSSLSHASIPQYLTSEDSASAALTRLSKLLLSDQKKQLLISMPISADALTHDNASNENTELMNHFNDAMKDSIRSKAELAFFKGCRESLVGIMTVSAAPPAVSLSSVSSVNHELQGLRSSISLALPEVKLHFVSSKDSSDLDIRIARLKYFLDSKQLIQNWIQNQCSRLETLLSLLIRDQLFHSGLRKFIQDLLSTLQELASQRADVEAFLQGVVEKASLPAEQSGSIRELFNSFHAIASHQLDLPELLPTGAAEKDVAAALSALTDCLDLSEEINAKDGASWEVEAEKGASDLDLLTQYVKSEMKAVRDKAESEEFNALESQFHKVNATISRIGDSAKIKNPNLDSFSAGIEKVAVWFFLSPDKLPEWQKKCQEKIKEYQQKMKH